MKKFLPYAVGLVLGLSPLAAFATTWTMTGATAPAGLAADVVGAGSAGAQFSLSMIGGTIGSVVILGIVGWALVVLSRLMSAGLHLGRK